MSKPQNQKGYSCRVNILKYVKVADKWRFAPAQTQNNKLKMDWVLVDGQPERHSEGTYYIEWYENGTWRRQSVKGFCRSAGAGPAQGHRTGCQQSRNGNSGNRRGEPGAGQRCRGCVSQLTSAAVWCASLPSRNGDSSRKTRKNESSCPGFADRGIDGACTKIGSTAVKKLSRPSANRRPTPLTSIVCNYLPKIARRPTFRMWCGKTFWPLSASCMTWAAGRARPCQQKYWVYRDRKALLERAKLLMVPIIFLACTVAELEHTRPLGEKQ